MPLPDDLLRRDAGDALRQVVLGLVSQAREAAPRCVDPEDAEGLHDFRVSIRRLRSTLSAWKGLLRGVVEKRDRRTLAGFQKRTGASRDAEVALEWLEGQVVELEPEHRPGCEWVAAQLRFVADVPPGDANRAVCSEFTAWAGGFESRLADREPGRSAGPLYAEALSDRLDRIAHRLAARVDGMGYDRRQGPHKVRIACKRLRYLVEPVRAESEVAASLVDRCKRLQDVLGALNDANVLDDLLKGYIAGLASGQFGRPVDTAFRGVVSPVSESGVLELCRRNAARAEISYGSFRADWLDGGGLRTLLQEAAALARQLRGCR